MAVFVNEHMLVLVCEHVRVSAGVLVRVCVGMRMYVKPTFLTVMFVLMQYKAMATLTNVRAHRVDALVLAAAVVLAALIFVCERHTCNTSLVENQQRDGVEGRGSTEQRRRREEKGGVKEGRDEIDEHTYTENTSGARYRKQVW